MSRMRFRCRTEGALLQIGYSLTSQAACGPAQSIEPTSLEFPFPEHDDSPGRKSQVAIGSQIIEALLEFLLSWKSSESIQTIGAPIPVRAESRPYRSVEFVRLKQ
jgi:hypothetical protein